MRTRSWSWPPAPRPAPDDSRRDGDGAARLTTGEIVARIAGTALLGGIAYALHRYGDKNPFIAAAIEAFEDAHAFPDPEPSPPPPPAPARSKPRRAKHRRARVSPPPPPPKELSPEELDQRAAALLGVPLDASEDTIRAAFRRVVTERLNRGRGFGDLATSTADQRATLEATNAKNRLMERARRMRG